MQIVRDLMERNVLTIPATMPFTEIVHLIVVAGVHGAPVIDDQGTVVGVISAMDLLRATEQAFDDERDEGEGSDPLAQLRSTTAIKLASPEPTWTSPETPAGELARLMRDGGIHRVLVGSQGRLDGIVTAFDLLRVVPVQ
jgi:CBS domain-containing protein